MKKSLLKKIPVANARDEEVSLFERFLHTNIQYLVSVQEEVIEDKSMLILNFYHKTNPRKNRFRVFVNKEDYITQDFSSVPAKWRIASLENMLDWYWYRECIVDDESEKILKSFLKVEDDLLEEINKLQLRIREERLSKKHKVIKDRIDKKMVSVKKLPKDFNKWINDIALYNSRYIYYNYKARKVLDGYCTHCGSDVKVEGARHNKKGICPKCKSHITYKATGKSRNIVDYGQAALFEKVEDELLVRYFSITKYYQTDYRNPRLEYHELARDFYNGEGKVDSYEWGYFKQTNEIRWCDNLSKFAFYDTVLYEKNIDRVLQDTIWKYSAIKEFATHRKGFGFSVSSYLEKYRKYPAIEYLVKLKLYNLTDDVISYYYDYMNNINLKGNNMFDVLGIDRTQFSTVQRINAGLIELEVIQELGKAGLKATDEQICLIADYLGVNSIIEMTKYTKYTTINRILKYIESQSSDVSEMRDVFSDWKDYVEDCKLLKYDLGNDFVLFPKDLAKTHRETYSLIEDNKGELFNSRIKEMHDRLLDLLGWEYGDSIITVPKTADDVIKEGQLLHHCVGRYVDKVAKGKTIVLFLRKKDEINKPYYTIELDPISLDIKQCRGKNNSSMDENVKKIINRYKKKLNKMNYLELQQAV